MKKNKAKFSDCGCDSLSRIFEIKGREEPVVM